MPPKLKLERARVAPEFIELMIQMYSEWITRNDQLIRRSIGNPRFEHFAHTARRLLPIVRRQSDDRVGLDYELTRLRGLPFTEFVVVEEPNAEGRRILWLCGRTKFVTITNAEKRAEIMGYLGCYNIYIPSTIIAEPELESIHMIPQRNLLSINRHPHHYLNIPSDVTRLARSPLSFPTGNCYGSYSGVIKGMLDEPDFPALFRQLYGHLSTYGYAPPRHMDQLDFDYSTPPER